MNNILITGRVGDRELKMRKLLRGLEILCKYDPDGTTCAEHDIIYAGGGAPSKISEEDLKALEDNGWFYEETEEGWCKFI